MERFFEKLWYEPGLWEKVIAWLLWPLSILYCAIARILHVLQSPKNSYGLKIISVGNLTVGGQGKTPIVQTLASRISKVVVVTRGYGRQSQGLIVVGEWGQIKCTVGESGDEAMMLAKKLPQACVIVSEDRQAGVEKAKSLGAETVVMDDGFRHKFEKFDILLESSSSKHFCLPAGPYRLPPSWKKKAALNLSEGRDYHRRAQVVNPTERMLLVTAIANPKRLDPFLPDVAGKMYYPDHCYFDFKTVRKLFQEHQATSLLVTQKDAVKLEGVGLPLSLLELEIEMNDEVWAEVEKYLSIGNQ